MLHRTGLIFALLMLSAALLSAQTAPRPKPQPVSGQTARPEQFGQRAAETGGHGERKDEEHGLLLRYHQDSGRNIRGDLYRESIRLFRGLLQDPASQWVQDAPQPLAVNSYLAGNGQMPGPNSGAVLDIAIDPGGTADQVLYAVSNDGGVWKTSDGGATWQPKTDFLETLSFGAVALDPTNSKVVYAGTGSIFNNGYFMGIGVYRSEDGGDTWKLTSGSQTLNGVGINRIVVLDANTLLVATYNGMFRSSDQGKTYTQVSMGGANGLYITDLDMNPGTTSPIWASVYGQGIFVSTDQGQTFSNNLWSAGTSGAPAQGTYGFVSLGVSSDGQTLYANAGGYTDPNRNHFNLALWKSADGGTTWENITSGTTTPQPSIPGWRQIQNCQCGYDQTLGVDPNNASVVYMGFQDLWKSSDGGNTWTDVSYNSTQTAELMHVDHHALVFSPPSHRQSGASVGLWVGNDGGIWSSADRGGAWVNHNGGRSTNLFRGIATGLGKDNNRAYGGMQDTGTAAGNGANWNEWLGGDGGRVAADPSNGQYAYGMWGNLLFTHDGGQTMQWSQVSCSAGNAQGYADLATDSQGNIYAAGQCQSGGSTKFVLFRSADHGATYTKFLDAGQPIAQIAASAADANTLWLGFSSGHVGKVTIGPNSPSLAVYTVANAIPGQAASVAVDPANAGRVVVVYAGYSGASNPSHHVFMTSDGGNTWSDISGGHAGLSVPDMPVYAAAIDSNMMPHSISIATDHGVLRSLDYGNSWRRLGAGLPNVHVIDLRADTTVNPSLLKAGTYGRSIWQTSLSASMLQPLSHKLLQVGNVTWTNNSTETLTVSWIDFNGNEITMTPQLAPGASVVWGPAWYVGVNVVRDQSGNIVLVYVINGNATNQAVAISSEAVAAAKANHLKTFPTLRSLPWWVPVSNFNVQNNSSETLRLYWIDQTGNANLIGTLAPGQGTTVGPVYFGGVFTLNDNSGVVSVFTATAAGGQNFTVTGALVNFWK